MKTNKHCKTYHRCVTCKYWESQPWYNPQKSCGIKGTPKDDTEGRFCNYYAPNTQIIQNCLECINDDLKIAENGSVTSTIVDGHNFDSKLERLNNQVKELTRAIKYITDGTCKKCKFNKTCENKTNLYSSDECDRYKQSVLANCEKCACKDVCYIHRDIVGGTKYEEEYFGEDVECLNYIEHLD